MTRTRLQILGLASLWACLLVAVALTVPTFFQLATITTVLRFSTILALLTLGQSLVVLAGGGGIDLSVGGIASLAGLAMAAVAPWPLGPVLGIVAALLLGAALGGINGVLVTRFGVVPLIATLATLFVYSGLAVALTGGSPIGGMAPWLADFGRGTLGPVPWPFLLLALPAYGAAALLLHAMPAGRWIYATGNSESAARLTGVPVRRLRLLLYTTSGLLAGAGGVVADAWLLSARPDIGQNLELQSLTAALLGGVAIRGGIGGVVGPLIAVLFLTALETGLQLANLNGIWQVGAIGLLLILSASLQRLVIWRT